MSPVRGGEFSLFLSLLFFLSIPFPDARFAAAHHHLALTRFPSLYSLSGNVLGYRLLRPCVSCSISRPTYTTYASAVANNGSSAPPSTSYFSTHGSEPRETLSAGGVTGGGVVDGLLFHFKLAAVTPVRRRIGITPAEELPRGGEWSTWLDSNGATLPSPAMTTTTVEAGAARGREGRRESAQQQRVDDGGGWRNRSALPARLREKPARAGDKMSWKHIPTAQVSSGLSRSASGFLSFSSVHKTPSPSPTRLICGGGDADFDYVRFSTWNDSAISWRGWLASRAIGFLRRARLGGSTTPSSSTRGSAALVPLSPNRAQILPLIKSCFLP